MYCSWIDSLKGHWGWTGRKLGCLVVLQFGLFSDFGLFHIFSGFLNFCVAVELIPQKAVEVGLAVSSAVWWAFNLVFSLTLASLLSVVGISGISAIHAIVSGLMFAVVLSVVPDIRDNTLQEIEEFYRIITNTPLDKKFRFSFRSNASTNTVDY